MPDKMPEKIKIVFIIDTLVGFAGTERHLFETVTHLNGDIFSCHIISFLTRERTVEEFRKKGINVLTIPIVKIYGLDTLKHLRELRRELKNIGPDIVQTFHFKADTLGVLAAKTAGVPCVISSRRDTGDLKKRSHLLLNRAMNRFIDRFIAVCEAASRTMQQKERIKAESIRVIYNGVDTNKFHFSPGDARDARRGLNIPADSFVVGIVSNFRPEKDIPTFFKAMTILKKEIPDLRVIAAGRGSSETQIRIGEQMIQFCRENGLMDQTLFPGYLLDVRPYIAAMDVACLTPKSNEGFSNAILEEMSMGKPVVATDIGGNAESVVDGETGYIIPPGRPEALAEKILLLYRNPEQRERMCRKARERVEKTFSIEKMIHEMERFYLSSLERYPFKGREWLCRYDSVCAQKR